MVGAVDVFELRPRIGLASSALASAIPFGMNYRGQNAWLSAGGGMDALHHLLERDPRSWAFRYDLGQCLPFGGRFPLYAVIHESCWADAGTTDWAAPALRVAERPPLDVTAIDNLPSMLPRESSIDYAAQLLPVLQRLDAIDAGAWGRAAAIYDTHAKGLEP